MNRRVVLAHDQVVDGHIVHIVQQQEIKEQSHLARELQKRGFDLPQATLSRRLKKLNVVKVGGAYKVLSQPTAVLPQVLSVKKSDFGFLVLHTHPGNANSLAYYFDQKYVAYHENEKTDSHLLGTIAGDDTVLVLLKNAQSADIVLSLLRADFPYLQGDLT